MNTTITSRIEEASKVILGIPGFINDYHELLIAGQEHIGSFGELPTKYIKSRLEALGIYEDDESLKLLESDDCTEGEARRAFCENGVPNLPPVRFKRVWGILKGKNSVPDTISAPAHIQAAAGIEKVVQAIRPIDNWSDEELIAAYGPDCPIDEMVRRSKGRAFVVFKNEEANIVDCDITLRMLREARKRETPVHYKSTDALKRLYRAGDFPSQVYEECPLHAHVLLLDGYCDECGHTWEGISLEAKQFARVLKESGEAPKDGPGIRQLLATARTGINALTSDYPKVSMKFHELKTEEKLPSLKSRKAVSTGKQDPFAAGKRY
jgi:hypothetical protein